MTQLVHRTQVTLLLSSLFKNNFSTTRESEDLNS